MPNPKHTTNRPKKEDISWKKLANFPNALNAAAGMIRRWLPPADRKL